MQNGSNKTAETLSERWHDFGTTHHLALAWNGVVMKTYVDGDDQHAWRFVTAPLAAQSGKLLIGNNRSEDAPYQGVIQSVRITGEAIMPDEFLSRARRTDPDDNTLLLYQFGAGRGDKVFDFSRRENHGFLSGAEWVANPD